MIKKGVAIVFALGVLAMLSLIGSTMVLSVIMEQKGTVNAAAKIKARYLADAGAARAIAELKYGNQGARNDSVDTLAETVFASGLSDNTLLNGRGSYSVTVTDCASRINLNGGNSNARLSLMLQNLSTVTAAGLTTAECDTIAANRPYVCIEEVKSKAGISGAKFAKIENFITVFGYIDPKVVDPQNLATPYVLQPRSPVNVNTAPEEVLRAVLMGIEAAHSCSRCGGDGYYFDVLGNHLDCPYCDGSGSPGSITGNLVITATEAQNLAQYIVMHRPYLNWESFYASIKSFFNNGTTSSDQEVVMANANPNTGFSWARNDAWASRLGYLGKYVIDINKNGTVEATDKGLTKSTTEFSFNSGGYYEIRSTGVYRTAGGVPLAQRGVAMTVRLFGTVKATSQSDFDGAGNTKTSVTTYPEPAGVGVSAAAYDGQIMLSRINRTTPNAGKYFRANYNTTLNADAGGGSTVLQNPPNPGSGVSGTKPNINSLASYSSRGELAPDGIIVDTYDVVCPDYLPSNNITYNAGTMEVWFKTMWNSNDTLMYNDNCKDRKVYRLMSRDEITGAGTKTWPFSTYVFYSQNFGGVQKGCSIGAQGYGYYQSGAWSYIPNTPEGSGDYKIEFCRNYVGTEAMGIWNSGKWRHYVITWKEPENGGMCNPANTGNWPGSYPNDLKVYMDGTERSADQYFHHLEYLDSTSAQYLMLGHEWWAGSGSVSHYERNQLNGVIGSVRIWDTQLSTAQVLAEYGAGLFQKTGTYVSPTLAVPAADGPTVEWGTASWTGIVPSSDESITMGVDTNISGTYHGNWTSTGTGEAIVDGSGNRLRSGSIRFRSILSSTKGTAAQPDADIMQNYTDPTFETHPPGAGGNEAPLPPGWGASGSWGTFLCTKGRPVHGGTWCAGNFGSGRTFINIPITGGKSYRFVGYSFLPSDPDVINCYYTLGFNGTGGYYSGEVSIMGTRDAWLLTRIPASGGWVTAPMNATQCTISLCSWHTGSAWIAASFDDLQLIEQGATVLVPLTDTPVIEDVSMTYLPKTRVLYSREF